MYNVGRVVSPKKTADFVRKLHICTLALFCPLVKVVDTGKTLTLVYIFGL